nr:MFS transporter [Aeromonas caviae]
MGMFLLCTFLMIILYPLGIDLYLVAVPRIAQTLQGSEAQIHTAFSIYLLGMAATVLPGGMLADRHGRRPVVLGGPSSSWSPPWWRRRRPASPSFIWGVSGKGWALERSTS